MAYSAVWSEAVPAGSLAASDLDQAIRDAKRDIRERVASVFGMADWSADPLVAQQLAFGTNPAQSGLIRAPNNVAITSARNSTNSADIIVSKLTGADIVELANAKVTIEVATGKIRFGTVAQKMLVTAAGTVDFRKADDSLSILLIDEASAIVQISNGVLNAVAQGVRTLFATAAALPAGAAAKDGLTAIDTTNNRLCYYSNGVRYFLATGTIF